MSEPLETIAQAVAVKADVMEVKGELKALSVNLRAHLAQQSTLNERMDRQLVELGSQSATTRERLVRLEEICCRLPGLEQRVASIEKNLSRYVGMAVGAALLVNAAAWFITNVMAKH